MKTYQKLDGKTEYYPFALRVKLRRRQRRTVRWLQVVAVLCLMSAAFLLARQYLFHGGQPSLTVEELSAGPSAAPKGQNPGGFNAEIVTIESAVGGAEAQTAEAASEETAPQGAEPAAVLPQYARLAGYNPDMIGWLKIPGTGIDYPVMQTPGNNEHYLRLGFDGIYSIGGSLFLDERCSVLPGNTTANLVIYGHNMNDGSMFSDLTLYENPEFCRNNPIIHFDSLWREGVYEIVAVVKANTDSAVYPYYHFFDAPDIETWNSFCASIAASALYDTGVTVRYGDELLTLSTCGSWLGGNERLGIVAKRVG